MARERRPPNGGPFPLDIFGYHGVLREPLAVEDWCFLPEPMFRDDLQWVRDHFDVIPLVDAAARLPAGFARPTAVITFDDGFQSTCDVALPILRETGLPATVFLCTDFIDTDQTLWFCRLHQALTNTRARSFEWRGRQFDVSDLGARARASADLQRELKAQPHWRLLADVSAIIDALGEDPSANVRRDSPFRILTRQAVHAMRATGLIEFGAHTTSHVILSQVPRHVKEREIKESISVVEALTLTPCRTFAYPNGRQEDYDQDCVRLLEALHIECAVTAISGRNGPSTGLLELRRHSVGPELRMADLVAAT